MHQLFRLIQTRRIGRKLLCWLVRQIPTYLPSSANIEIGLCVQKCNALLQSPRQSASSHLNVSLGNADRNVGIKVEQQHWPALPPKDIGV